MKSLFRDDVGQDTKITVFEIENKVESYFLMNKSVREQREGKGKEDNSSVFKNWSDVEKLLVKNERALWKLI